MGSHRPPPRPPRWWAHPDTWLCAAGGVALLGAYMLAVTWGIDTVDGPVHPVHASPDAMRSRPQVVAERTAEPAASRACRCRPRDLGKNGEGETPSYVSDVTHPLSVAVSSHQPTPVLAATGLSGRSPAVSVTPSSPTVTTTPTTAPASSAPASTTATTTAPSTTSTAPTLTTEVPVSTEALPTETTSEETP